MATARNKWLVGTVAAVTLSGAALWEGKRNVPYIPIPGDVPTVCYGETKVQMRRYSDAECLSMLKHSLVKYSDGVLKCINVPINLHQHAAFTLFGYNNGVPAFCNSGAVEKLNAYDYAGACAGLLPYRGVYRKVRQPDGTMKRVYVVIKGSQNRRQYEYNLCMKPAPAEPSNERGLA